MMGGGNPYCIIIFLQYSSIMQLNMKCSTCGHTQDLHRKRNAKDNLILGELMSASSNRCSSVIPMSELHQMSMFGSYSPIPIPPDDITNEVCIYYSLSHDCHVI